VLLEKFHRIFGFSYSRKDDFVGPEQKFRIGCDDRFQSQSSQTVANRKDIACIVFDNRYFHGG
jgi:hypothetical protein